MPEPLVQTIKSRYDDADVKRYIRDLERIKKLEQETGQNRPGSRPGGGLPAPGGTNKTRRALRELKQTMAEARVEFNRLNLAHRRGELSNKEFADSVEKMRRRTERALEGVSADFKELPRDVRIALGRAENSLDRFSTRTREVATGQTRLRTRIGQGVRDALGFTRGAVLGGSVAAGAAAVATTLTKATKAAIAWQTAFAGVEKTVEATSAELDILENGLRNLAKEVPASTTEIARVAEAAGQLGIETDNILGFTRTMIDLGAATNLSADQAATALARLANITGLPQSEFDRLGSTVVDLGNNLATTEAEIVDMALRLAGAGNTVGLTEAQILGLAGALSSVGVQAELGGSTLSRILLEMQKAALEGGDALDISLAIF